MFVKFNLMICGLLIFFVEQSIYIQTTARPVEDFCVKILKLRSPAILFGSNRFVPPQSRIFYINYTLTGGGVDFNRLKRHCAYYITHQITKSILK